MKSLLSLLIIFFAHLTIAQLQANTKANVNDHLYEVNEEWSHYLHLAPDETNSFQNDIDRISLHLQLVAQILRDKPSVSLTDEQRNHRLELLDELKTYAHAKVFPTNTYHKVRTPYFIDNYGVHCAVGYLIMKSGHGDLSQQISREHNYNYLRDITTEGIPEWANKYGFTLEELAWIQPGYIAPGTYLTLGQGVNAQVLAMAADDSSNKIYVAGDFTELEAGNNCSAVAYYENGLLHCMEGSLQGTANDIHVSNGVVYASGLFEYNQSTYSLAIFENNNWSYHNVAGTSGYVGHTVITGNGSDFDYQIVVDGNNGNYEIWQFANGLWEQVAIPGGPVHSMATDGTSVVYAGMFNSFVALDGGNDIIVDGTNVAINEIGTNNWSAPTGPVADEIFKVKWLNNNFFFSGKATQTDVYEPMRSFAVLHADSITPMLCSTLAPGNLSQELTIYDFASTGDSTIVVCGDFFAGIMYFGNGIAELDYSDFSQNVGLGFPYETAYATAKGSLMTEIPYAAVVHNSSLYVGGELTSLKNVVQLDESLGLSPAIDFNQLTLYPNPTSAYLNIEVSEFQQATIYTMDGSLVQTKNESLFDVRHLKTGGYIVEVKTKNGATMRSKFIKNE